MPRPQPVPCSHALCFKNIPRRLSPHTIISYLLRLLSLLIVLNMPAARAHATPQLWLPTPPGESWRIIQGYGCGSHNSWDRYSLDMVNADGRTRGAPVRAAADGRIWSWTGKSGTLILDHGGGFYTMYSHMDSVVTTKQDTLVARGMLIGSVGDRAANGTPHLHFTAFTGEGLAARNRRSVPLAFGEGYDLPEIGGCNQHAGERVLAGALLVATSAGVQFSGETQPTVWYNADKRIEFSLPSGANGFSQAWDRDPGGDAPQFLGAEAGYLQLAQAGEGLHIIQVRVWEAGNQALATYGPVGYDVTPPQNVVHLPPTRLASGTKAMLHWGAPADNGSGVAGYRIYVGSDPNGTSDWFSPAPQTETPALAPGDYLLRVQPLDYAGNAGAWATIQQISVTK
jgi:hypothetical protein